MLSLRRLMLACALAGLCSAPPAALAADLTPIEDIQGTGAESPLQGREVTTQGVVTGVWDTGGFKGFSLQTGGTGTRLQSATDASHGIFVSVPAGMDYPGIGNSVQVRGTVKERYGDTRIRAKDIEPIADLPAVTPVDLPELPGGDAAREAYEDMLVLPRAHTVTDNYSLHVYGIVGLNGGDKPLFSPTELYPPSLDPDSPTQKALRDNAARLVYLDDGRTGNYTKKDRDVPVPYIAQNGHRTIKTLRTTDEVTFQRPVVVRYAYGNWTYQPQRPVTGDTLASDLPIAWEESRPPAPQVEGEYSIGAFNVLNYFTTLGTDRGAGDRESFTRQQAKIVQAINLLDSDILALSEVENGYAVTGDPAQRDNALAQLTEALNQAGGRWDYVRSPDALPVKGDVIRTAFIFDPAKFRPVGQSRILADTAFTRSAREPLAQEFASVTDPGAEHIVAVANHFKSKGYVKAGGEDRHDGQGNNANFRDEQSWAVLRFIGEQEDWADKPIFVLGDFNAYTHENALNIFRDAGYSLPAADYGATTSFAYDGRLGTLDHVLANEKAAGMVTDAQVWDINADEPVAFEYSKYNQNVVNFYQDNPYRSSDHDPLKVGFTLRGPASPPPASAPEQEGSRWWALGLGFAALLAVLLAAGIAVVLIRRRH